MASPAILAAPSKPAGEVAGGQAAGLVQDVDQDRGAVGVEPALRLGDGVGLQGIDHLLAPFIEQGFVGDGHAGCALCVQDDQFDSLAGHD
jgi:hypothetical protein